jgi:hypothetical protein
MIPWAFAHPYLFAFCGTPVACVVALACVDLSANIVKGFVLLFARKEKAGPSFNKALIKEFPSPPPPRPSAARVTFFTPAGNPLMTHKEMAEFLFSLLDDIDTASDMAKGDNEGYRKLVEKLQARRYETGITSDGQRLIFPEPAK